MAALDKFGEFLIRNFRDKAIEQHLLFRQGLLRAKAIQDLQSKFGSLPEPEKDLMTNIVVDLLDTALHDLLFAFQEAHDLNESIEIVVDGKSVAEESGMLNGEHLGDDGWINKFSRFANM